jgi:UDP-N-acetylglucosamine:LPS N-acetylglucosamine transferase
MKILFVIDSLGSGGAQRQSVTLSRLFVEQGYKVEFLVYHDANFFKPLLLEKNIKINRIIAKSNIDRILKVRKFIRQNNQNAVISFLDTPNLLACIAAIGGKSWKLIISERSGNKQNFDTRKHKLYRWFYRFTDTIVCNSERAKQMWTEYCPQYANKLTTIYNTVQLPKILTEYIPKREDKLQIVVFASYQYIKNPIGVVKVLCLLNKEERSKIHIDWYGRKQGYDTKAYGEAIQLIESNHLNDTVCLHDTISNVADIMNQADVVGLFSQYEGLSNTICEGMLIGKPIIMTKVSDYDVLVDSTNGFLCDWDKPDTIKKALIQASNLTIEELIEMGKVSKQKEENLFSPQQIIDKWLFIINL